MEQSLKASSTIPVCAAADKHPHSPRRDLPANTCDCHAHIFGPTELYPLASPRIYTPAPASFDEYTILRRTLGITRSVIVQPSVYGTDNRATLDAVKRGGDNYRAIVVVDSSANRQQLEKLHDQGARGVRINVVFGDRTELDSVRQLATTLAELGWHLQMLVDISRFTGFDPFVRELPVPVVLDHMGHLPVARGVNSAGFKALLGLLDSGQCWVKLSGAYRMTEQSKPPYTDVAPLAKALVETNPQRLVWATDWPHPHIPVEMPNDGDLVNMFEDWLPNDEVRQQIYVHNPAQLYGFTDNKPGTPP